MVIAMDLVSVLHGIYQSEIDVTLRSRGDLGWQLQLEMEDGQVVRGIVSSAREAATWLHEQTLLHFPTSTYAQLVRGEVKRALPSEPTARRLDGT